MTRGMMLFVHSHGVGTSHATSAASASRPRIRSRRGSVSRHGYDPGLARDLPCAGRGHCSLPEDELRRRAAELLEILVAIVDVALALELGEGMVVTAPPPTAAVAASSLGSSGPAAPRLSEATGIEAMALRHLLEADPAQGGFQRGEDPPLAAVQRIRVRGLDGAVRPHLSAQPPGQDALGWPPVPISSRASYFPVRTVGTVGTALIQQGFPCPDYQKTWSGQSGHQLRHRGSGSGRSERQAERSGQGAAPRLGCLSGVVRCHIGCSRHARRGP